MGNIFSASEIVELGIRIEKNGRDFYTAVARQSASDEVRNIFQYLAGEEAKHITIFQKILEKTQRYEPDQVYADEYLAYMNALASEHIFTQENKGTEVAQKVKDNLEAVNLGIGFEKDSIIFYEGLRTVVPHYDRQIIAELIQHEQNHLKQLVELKKNL